MRLLLLPALLLPLLARADCLLELELLAHDLAGLKLSETQKFALNPHVEDAQKRCRVQREAASLEAIGKARRVAGIERRPDDDPDAPPPGGSAR